MFETFKLMSACTNKEYLSKDIDTLAIAYQKTQSARERNRLIATIFCKLYPMMLKISRKYFSLTNEQKTEHALYHLVKALERFDNKKMKFSSFFHTHFSNQMKSLLTSESNYKRAAFQNIVKHNEEALNVYVQSAPDKDFKDSDLGLIEDIKNSSYLSTEEKEYCTCVIQGVDTSKEISQMMNLNQRMPLKRPLISSLISIDEDTKKLLEEKATAKNIKKIKDSLKRKMDAYKKEGTNIFRD